MGLLKELNRFIGRGHRVVFIFSLLVFLSAEVLFFLKFQTDLLLRNLKEDFSVIVTLEDNTQSGSIEKIENKLKSLPQIYSVKFFSKKKSLDFLKNSEPEFFAQIKNLGENPMPAYFELKLSAFALSDIKGWVEKNLKGKISEISQVHYNFQNAFTILQVNFYKKFLWLVLSLLALLVILLAVVVEFSAVKKAAFSFKKSIGWILSSIAASLTGIFLMWLWIYPINNLNPQWWSWPPLHLHLVVIFFSAVFGWTLYRWKNTY